MIKDALRSAAQRHEDPASSERALILFLHESFSEVDADRDGAITRREFVRWTSKDSACKRLREYGVRLERKALGKAYDMLDLDGDGKLHRDEFVVGLSYLQDALTLDDRKQRFVIDGIVRRQQGIRTSVSIFSTGVLFALVSGVGLASAVTVAGLLPAWYATAVPAGASALMLGTSVAESAGSWSRGSARFSASQALEQAFRGEVIMAEANINKAFIPFGVGLTAIAAAAAAGLKIVVETERDFLSQKLFFTDLLDVGDVLVVFLALAAVLGASFTSDQSLRMRATLKIAQKDELFDDRPRQMGSSNEWMSRALRPVGKPPSFQERAGTALLTLVLCLLPLPFVDGVRDAEDTPTLVNAASVVIAEAAAALAAITFVVAEKDFANQERRVAIQAKNAALAELFSAQTAAEAAVLPASTALSGAAVGGAAVFVEISRWLAAVTPLPAGLAVLRSGLGAVLARLEARATWLQRGLSMASSRSFGNIEVVGSSLRELERVLEQFSEDQLSQRVSEQLQRLPVGRTEDFEDLIRDDRRKVHLVASGLGMPSISLDRQGKRVVRVTNLGYRPPDPDLFGRFLETLKNEVNALWLRGVPLQSRLVFGTASLIGLGGSLVPLVAGRLEASLSTPLITAGVALLTVQQERLGVESAANAARYSSGMGQLVADANSFVARATMTFSFLPSALAASTFVTSLSLIGFIGPTGDLLAQGGGLASLGLARALLYLAVLPTIPVSMAMYVISVWRLRRITDFTMRAAELLQAEAHFACRVSKYWAVWPVLSAMTLFFLPCDVFRRITIASSLLMGGTAVVMAAASVQVARGENFVARSSQILAAADAWSSEASKATSLLPFESDAAVVMALLAAALSEAVAPASSVFPLAGVAICLRALQLQGAAQKGATEAKNAAQSLQELRCAWPWQEKEEVFSSRRNFATLPALPAWRILLKRFQGVGNPLQMSLRQDTLLKTLSRKLSAFFFEGPTTEKEFGPDAAEGAVQNVQRDLDELGATRNSREQGMSGTFSFLAAFSLGCFLVPVFLYSSAPVILPIAGAGLTLFTAAEDSKARTRVSDSKIRAAGMTANLSTMEVALSVISPYKARLVSATGLTAMGALLALALEHSAAHHALVMRLMEALVVGHALAAAWAVWPLQAVWHWADRVRRASGNLSGRPLNELGLGRWTSACAEMTFGVEPIALGPWKRTWPLLFALPSVLFMFWPFGHSFPKRAVASCAAGAGVVAFALFLAERASARAERLAATRASTTALTDAFANEGEQQRVLLPLAASGCIACSALITFLVELNPFSAAALTLLQTAAWVLAARRSVAVKCYTRGAEQVEAVTERPGSSTAA